MERDRLAIASSIVRVSSHRWVEAGVFQTTYAQLLSQYACTHTAQYYIVDSSHVKNAYGRQGLGRSPVDRGRKGLKVSVLTDANGVVHNIRSDAANISDFHLFSPMLSSILINLRRIEVFADRGYDSKANRTIAYRRGFLPSPHGAKRKCRSSKRQNGKRSPLTSCQSEHTFAWIDNFRRLRVQYEWTPCHKHFFWTLRHAGKAIRLFIRIIASMTCPRDMQHDDSPEDDNNGNSYTAHTYAQSCQTLIPDAEHLAKLRPRRAQLHECITSRF